VRETDESGLLVDGGCQFVCAQTFGRVAAHEPQSTAGGLGQALEHVAVGRKVAGVAHNDKPVGPGRQGGAGQLVKVDGRAVADDHLTRAGSDEAPDPVPHHPGQIDPT
jgi:hypothetical protein